MDKRGYIIEERMLKGESNMSCWIMVSADLHDCSVEQRQNFDKCLRHKGWIKIADVTTTWAKEFNSDNNMPDKALDEINDSVLTNNITVRAIENHGQAAPRAVDFPYKK